MTRRTTSAGPPAPPETLRLSQSTRDQITTLKRRTGVKHMNVLCRWALCRSLAEPAPPPPAPADSAAEIAWKVFAGPSATLWWGLLLVRHADEGPGAALDEEAAAGLLRAHVARGMSYLAGDPEIRDATSLARMALGAA
jgi:DNA sulfur modification protein DndE